MPQFRTGEVTAVLAERPGLQRVSTTQGRAYVLTQLTGTVAVGDQVVLNTTAVSLGLGTGSWHVVHWNLARTELDQPGPGHIMKLRYTSLQADTGAAEEAGPMALTPGLEGLPVVVCSLHSQAGAVVAAIRAERPGTRVAYVMTDGAALGLAMSDLVADLQERGLLAGTVSAGHAFGGDLEAVTVASALLLARDRLDAEAVVVGMGPGVVGTGTPTGTTALEVAGLLDTASWLGASPIACLRVSDADPRERHRGLSHHTRTALDAAFAGVVVAATPSLLDELSEVPARHRVEVVTDAPDLAAVLVDLGLSITTMGRGPDQEPRFFEACAAAGALAARSAGSRAGATSTIQEWPSSSDC